MFALVLLNGDQVNLQVAQPLGPPALVGIAVFDAEICLLMAS